MRRILYIGLLSMTQILLGAEEPLPEVKVESVPVKTKKDPYGDFRNEAAKLLDILYRECPEAFGNLSDPKQREKLLSRLTTAAVPDARYFSRPEPDSNKSNVKSKGKKNLSFAPVKLSEGKIYYYRIDDLSEANVAGIPKESKKTNIVDLRNCFEGNFNAAEKLLNKVDKHCLIIIGPRTCGPAEAMAVVAGKRGAVIMGESSMGMPFPIERVKLDGGALVMIPNRPEAAVFMDVPGESVSPVVPVKTTPQVNYSELKKSGSAGKDKCLQRAVELVTVLKLIKSGKNKK